MAFFGLAEIRYEHDEVRDFGPLSVLDSVNSSFKDNALKYPLDVGSADKGHYVIFFVREQKNTQFSVYERGGQYFEGNTEDDIQKAFSTGTSVADKIRRNPVENSFGDKINNVVGGIIQQGTSGIRQYGGKAGQKVASGIENWLRSGEVSPKVSLSGEQKSNDNVTESVKRITDKSPFGFMNRTQLTTDTVALYMPDTIQFDSRQSYDGLSPGKELLGQALVALPGLVDAYKNAPAGSGGKVVLEGIKKTGALQMLGERVVGGVTGAPDTTRLAAFGVTGRVVNPMLELIYNSPDFRQFQFEFFFWPRDEKEAVEVQKIIERFRFHQAPELEKISGKQSGLLIPPSEFDIQFFYAGRQNPNLPPIASCVLENIQVNYTPRGWAAYEVPGENNPSIGRTGMPVGIQLTLSFRETTYITKEDFSSAIAAQGKMPSPLPEKTQDPDNSFIGEVPMNSEFETENYYVEEPVIYDDTGVEVTLPDGRTGSSKDAATW